MHLHICFTDRAGFPYRYTISDTVLQHPQPHVAHAPLRVFSLRIKKMFAKPDKYCHNLRGDTR
jgi:hypothetical protein